MLTTSPATKAFEKMAHALLENKEAEEVRKNGLARAVISMLKNNFKK